MRKKEPPEVDLNDDLRPEYPAEFFRDMKPNRFAGMDLKFKGKPPIQLDEDVAEVFDTPEALNIVLRSAIKAMRHNFCEGRGKTNDCNKSREEAKIYKGRPVVLDPDVSSVFVSSEAVNAVLRDVIHMIEIAGPNRGTLIDRKHEATMQPAAKTAPASRVAKRRRAS